MSSYGAQMFVQSLNATDSTVTNSAVTNSTVTNVTSNSTYTDEIVVPKQGTTLVKINTTGDIIGQRYVVMDGSAEKMDISRDATGGYISFDATGCQIRGNTTTQTVGLNLDLSSTTNLFPGKYDQVISDLANLEARVTTLEAGGGGGTPK